MEMITVEYAYQVSLKVKEKLARKQSQWNRGKTSNKGRGTIIEKLQKLRGEDGRYNS
jgi:hypothetical protein